MNHRQSMPKGNLASDFWASHDGYRILTNLLGEELKILQETKKLLDKRISLDEQYARNLQELTGSADRISSTTTTHPIATISREVFLRWSNLATTVNGHAEQFRRIVMETLLKDLIEQKTDSKRFLEDEKRRYDTEHRKASSDLIDTEKRYFDDAKSYAAKNAELNRLTSANRRSDDARVKHIKESLLEKRATLCRTHNDYVAKLREFNFIDEQYVRKLRQLLHYHEEIQMILNKSWKDLLDGITNYKGSNVDEKSAQLMMKMIGSIDLWQCYEEISRANSHLTPIKPSPQVFNDLLLQSSNFNKLKSNEFFADSSTKNDLKQRIEQSTEEIDMPSPTPIDNIRDKQAYLARKTQFERELQLENLRQRRLWQEKLRRELTSVFTTAGYRLDDESNDESDEDIADRLEDQPYFHGVTPRIQSLGHLVAAGDYLVRINEKGQIVLSILWNDPQKSDRLKDGHFIIQESNKMYSFKSGVTTKPSVHELLTFYKRQKFLLRDDGTRLIRAVARPDYIINNDDVRLSDSIGKGNFGQVMRGEYRGRQVAVKLLHPSSADRTAQDRQNFINEALLLQQYKHKNIVKFLGIAAIKDPMMIVMELIEQGSLNQYLQKNELRSSKLIQMSCDIAKGMEYLERSNVIHRDLATRNCLVDRRGRVKVADFGLSRCLESDEEYFCKMTHIPVRWWAVEVFSHEPYTSKSDVWSYGVTMWEVFSKAQIPYSDIPHNHHVIDAIKRGQRLNQPDRCSVTMYSIMSSCWAFDPKDRPNFEKLVELIKKERPLF